MECHFNIFMQVWVELAVLPVPLWAVRTKHQKGCCHRLLNHPQAVSSLLWLCAHGKGSELWSTHTGVLSYKHEQAMDSLITLRPLRGPVLSAGSQHQRLHLQCVLSLTGGPEKMQPEWWGPDQGCRALGLESACDWLPGGSPRHFGGRGSSWLWWWQKRIV